MRLANFLRIAKPIAGTVLLLCIVAWIMSNGEAMEHISIPALIYSTLISGLTVGLNAVVLKLIVEYFEGFLSYRNAFRLSALGTLGNALGGLPIGTTLKYALLYRDSGIKIREITSGLVIFTLAGSCWLLAYAALSIQYTPLHNIAKVAVPLALCFGVAALVMLLLWARNHGRLGQLVKPFIVGSNLARVLFLSFAVTTTFVANYSVVAHLMFPDVHLSLVAFIASVGTFISLGSALQSVGGVAELSMGLSSSFSGLDAATGATLALALRFTAIVAAASILAGLLLSANFHR
jgi:uncharacterized membrane protein YbhN (UPF0104 family)